MSSQPEQMQDESEEVVGREQPQSSNSPRSPSKPRQRNPNVCSNKICTLFKNTKHNQNHENNVQNLCVQCQKQYEKQLYCLYCKQIYFEFSDDGKEWIMCDQCERWVHTQCADFSYNGNNSNSHFNCLRCRKIEVAPTSRRNGNNRSNIIKVPERRKTQECTLNNFGFYWQLSPAELAEDVEKLKMFMK